MTTRSHGDGRRMTLSEAVERRARMIRFHGSLERAREHGLRTGRLIRNSDTTRLPRQQRDWVKTGCVDRLNLRARIHIAEGADDVVEWAGRGGPVILPACPACRGAA